MSKEKPKYYEVKYKKVITYRVIGKGIENGYSLNWIGEDDLNIDADMGWSIKPISPKEEYDIEGITQEEDDDAITSKEITEEEAIKLAKEISRIGLKEKTPCECSICLYDGDCNEKDEI